MERQASTWLGPLSGLMLGIAISACATVVSAPRVPAPDASRTVHTAPGLASVQTSPAPHASHDLDCAAMRSQDRPQRPGGGSASAAERVYAEVDRRTRALDASVRRRIAREILAEAARAGLDPLLVVAVIHVESSFDPDAVSIAGAAGLMQLRAPTMGEVAARFGLHSTDRLDPVANIQAGVRYLSALLDSFRDVELALMAYNAGPGRIRRHLREGGLPERFRAYPQSVARELDRLGGSLDNLPSRARLAVNVGNIVTERR